MSEFSRLFTRDGHVETLSVREVVAWHCSRHGSRLVLPPIQRSLVWKNDQIINYWDSLLRGYPAGMMMVHRSSEVTNVDGPVSEEWNLFDGQQRLAAVLLGLGIGVRVGEEADKPSRRLWVDLGTEPDRASGLKFQLRVSSKGQPFGYQASDPNRKYELWRRRKAWMDWEENFKCEPTIETVIGPWLIERSNAIPLASFFTEDASGILSLVRPRDIENGAQFDRFMEALKRALDAKIVFVQLPAEIVGKPDEYVRFFGRVGQGGTRLSEDELTYSMVKYRLPHVRGRMEQLRNKVGRMASELDYAIAALRIAQATSAPADAKEWEIAGRPGPAFVTKLLEGDKWLRAREEFKRLVPCGESRDYLLAEVAQCLRAALEYNAVNNRDGLPKMLLGRLPKQLIDCLLLLAVKQFDGHGGSRFDEVARSALVRFVLHWLMFVGNDDRAAYETYKHLVDKNGFLSPGREPWTLSNETVREVIALFESKGIARIAPRLEDLSSIEKELERPTDGKLRAWKERFKAVDAKDDEGCREALRILSTHRTIIGNVLLWIQRYYVSVSPRLKDYDPTSDRDDDLPVDLDHLIPQAVFGDDWRKVSDRIFDGGANENFRQHRSTIGHSLGNFRWLDASDNRARGAGEIKLATIETLFLSVDGTDDNLIHDLDRWNGLIRAAAYPGGWSPHQVSLFQSLIDRRTVRVYGLVLKQIADILPTRPTRS